MIIPNKYLFSSKKIPGSTKFYIFDFHEYFDGILGTNDLQKVSLNILLDQNLLTNRDISLSLKYRQTAVKECNNIVNLLRLSHIKSHSDREELVGIIKKFPNIILGENDKLTFTSQVKHEIPTIDERTRPRYIQKTTDIHQLTKSKFNNK